MLNNSKRKSTYPSLDARLALDDKRRSVLDSIVDGYYESDLRGGMVIVNDSLCEIFGCDSDNDLLGDDYNRYMDAANNHLIRDAFAGVIASGTAAPAVECAITRSDGRRAWIEFSITPLRAVNGRISGFRGIVRDVSERHRSQEMTNARYRLFQQITTELSETLELEEVLDAAMRAASTLTGADSGFIGLIEPNQVRLARVFGGFNEQWVPLDLGIIARVIRTQQAEFVEDVESDPDYSTDLPTTCAEIAVPLTSRGKLVGVLNLETSQPGYFTSDIFECSQLLGTRIGAAIGNARRYMEQQSQIDELSRKYARTSELEELKTDMIRVAAHDLRGPLALIGSYTELLAEDLASQLGEQQKQFINSIRQSVERMTQMTTDILSLERLNQHRDVTLMRVPLGALLEHVVSQYANESRNRGQHIHVNTEPASVYGDSSEILEAIANLLGNAVKYTPSGGQIEAHLLREGDMAVLEIIDSGYGVPPEQLDRLFQPFQRIRTHETQNIEGTGLGLYLVKKIIERHGGQVHVESQYGRGSTFGFRLPLAK
jgi:PAS domain S-box-containing protein